LPVITGASATEIHLEAFHAESSRAGIFVPTSPTGVVLQEAAMKVMTATAELIWKNLIAFIVLLID
jgi:hypothetical protein